MTSFAPPRDAATIGQLNAAAESDTAAAAARASQAASKIQVTAELHGFFLWSCKVSQVLTQLSKKLKSELDARAPQGAQPQIKNDFQGRLEAEISRLEEACYQAQMETAREVSVARRILVIPDRHSCSQAFFVLIYGTGFSCQFS